MSNTQHLDDIASIIGDDGLADLATAWGGRRIYVPESVSPSHPIALRIGWPRAQMLASAWGGDYLNLPSRRTIGLGQRNRDIREQYRNGVTQSALATQYDLTERQIRNIISSEEQTHA